MNTHLIDVIGRARRTVALAVAATSVFTLLAAGPAAQPAPPQTTGTDAAVEKRIDALLAKLSLHEKIDLLGGVDAFYVREMPSIGLPRLKMADGPFGVRGVLPSTAAAAGIALASSWDPGLAERVGRELGRDARARGVHFLLAPGVNIYRAPMNGRNFEYYGEDPLLAGKMAVGYIRGVQSQGVSATVKHFLVNNSEFDRHHTDSIVDERALREIYMPAFEAAVKEGKVAALMTSYNLVNGVHASQAGAFNNDVLKKDWNFDGIVMSDWTSTYDGVGAANGGLDLEMPSGVHMNRETLRPAIEANKVGLGTIDDKLRRLLRVAIRLGWLERDQLDQSVPVPNPQGTAVALEGARAGMVLLRNERGILPLDKSSVKSVAVIGPLAYPAVPVGGGSAGVVPFRAVSVVEGLAEAFGPNVPVHYHRGLPSYGELADRTSFTVDASGSSPGVTVQLFDNTTLSGTPTTRVDARINLAGPFVPTKPALTGTVRFGESSARWTGYFTPTESGPYRLFVFDFRGEGGCRAMVDGTTVLDNWEVSKAQLSEATLSFTPGAHKVVLECFRRRIPGSTGVSVRLGIVPESQFVEKDAVALASKADVVVAAVGFDNQAEAESGDRTFALPVGQDLLLRALAGANPRTVVTVTSGGGVDMTSWLERVPAVVMTWFAGEQGGTALAQLLTGQANFSGRLPISIERRWEDNPNLNGYYPKPGTVKVTYENGVFVGYRGYDAKSIAPLFPFGFGLSYTTFTYGALQVVPAAGVDGPAFTVAFDVTNTGSREGAEVAQVYVVPPAGKVPRPPKELKGFARVALMPGETKRVSVTLDARAFTYWDSASHAWQAAAGTYGVKVGGSSASLPLSGAAVVGKDATVPVGR